jgi:uncharacterized RmlC-like cupin family protein
LQVSESYSQLLDKARWSHGHGRNVSHITQVDVDAARLFSYGYRSQSIGAFHATRMAIEAEQDKQADPIIATYLEQARSLLGQLEASAMDPILNDFRALISTLYFYDLWTNSVDQLLGAGCQSRSCLDLERIRRLFLENVGKVTSGNGLYVASDLLLPEQGSFLVPNLDIAIAPIIYGDHHSWNAAFLAGDQAGVSVHRHREGAEIHLGYSRVEGQTILGCCFSEVNEGYAMPIPPETDHGFLNTSGHNHVLPFVFGSLKMGGWGIFFDVEPRQNDNFGRKKQPLESVEMNRSVYLERAIRQMKSGEGCDREILISASHAGAPGIGGLELGVNRVHRNAIELRAHHYRIISVHSGKGHIRMGNAEAIVGLHDHFGIPAEMDCQVTSWGTEPLVFLDAVILPVQ